MSQLESDLFALHFFREGYTRATTTLVAVVPRHVGWNVACSDSNVFGVQVQLRFASEA